MKFIVFTLVILVATFNIKSIAALDNTPFAVATWVERENNTYKVLNSVYIEHDTDNTEPELIWSAPELIHSSQKPITSTSLVTLSGTQHFLFWAELNGAKSSIMYKTKSVNSNDWGNAVSFYDKGKENIGINLLRHKTELWAFWGTTDSQLPDIKYRIYRDGRWSEATLAHPSNAVPDIQPVASISEDGDINLSWLTYSFTQSNYVKAQKVFSNQFNASELIDIIDVLNFEKPDFIPSGQTVTLRFPRNQLKQSKTVAYFANQRPE